MKKTVWVLSLVVMLLSQIITPFAYAVSGEEVPMPESVVEEIVPEPEVVEPEKTTDLVSPEYDQESVIVIVEPEKSWELSWDNNEYSWVVIPKEKPEVQSGAQSWIELGISSWDIDIFSWDFKCKEKNLEEEDILTWTEASSWFIEKITESIKELKKTETPEEITKNNIIKVQKNLLLLSLPFLHN